LAIPAPPATISAPVVLEVEAVVLVPSIVVNRPLAAVVAPTVAPLIVPPVMAAPASCDQVNTDVPAVFSANNLPSVVLIAGSPVTS
jgi:hypothetical protein